MQQVVVARRQEGDSGVTYRPVEGLTHTLPSSEHFIEIHKPAMEDIRDTSPLSRPMTASSATSCSS